MLLLCTLCFLQATAADTASEAKKHLEKPYALIFGTVWGPDSHPLYAVKVKIRRAQDKKARWELHSDHNGEFAQRLPAGQADYLVWADLDDYKSLNGKQLRAGPEIKVHIENDERADIGLHLTY
jgi:hypothetical protein